MVLYDEKKAVEAIKALPPEAKAHLNHVARNWVSVAGSCLYLKVTRAEYNKEMKKFEKRWKDLGL